MNDNLEKFEFCISSKDLTEHILKTIAIISRGELNNSNDKEK